VRALAANDRDLRPVHLPETYDVAAHPVTSGNPADSSRPAKHAARTSASTIRHASGGGPLFVRVWCWALGENAVQLPFDVVEQSCGPLDLVG
jgi:hypothetical protein